MRGDPIVHQESRDLCTGAFKLSNRTTGASGLIRFALALVLFAHERYCSVSLQCRVAINFSIFLALRFFF